MATRWQLTAVTLCMILAAASLLRADIYRWDNNQLIPGTEGITPGPGVQLDHRELEYAALGNMDLAGASFEESDMTNAWLDGSALIDANLTGAVVRGTSFYGTTSLGFTKEQLYSTRSYQDKDLRGIHLMGNDLTDWSFAFLKINRS